MLIAVVSAGMLALTSPSPAPCTGADLSVTALNMKVVKATKKTPVDRVLITADMANVGSQPQKPNIEQHAELLQNGKVTDSQRFPSLGAGVVYPLQFRIFRDPKARKDPLQVIVRYVLDEHNQPAENCSIANDSMEKIF